MEREGQNCGKDGPEKGPPGGRSWRLGVGVYDVVLNDGAQGLLQAFAQNADLDDGDEILETLVQEDCADDDEEGAAEQLLLDHKEDA